MKLENQVCTLEQAKRLKELGIEQNSLFTWCLITPDPIGENWYYALIYKEDDSPSAINSEALGSAFTVAELGAMLVGYEMPFYWKLWGEYCFKVAGQPKGYGTEAQARATYMLHLLESETITPSDCNQRLLNS